MATVRSDQKLRASSTTGKRPNIVVILADDMGYADIGCYGGEINTPNIDRLATEGTKFSQMYNCARCCPTRACLLTGMYPHRAGVGFMVMDWQEPGYRGFLRDDCATVAETLKTAGYNTYMSGKWHVGGEIMSPHRRPGYPGCPVPTQRGFDRYWGMLGGATSYFNPHTLMHDGSMIDAPSDEYFTDSITNHACDYIDDGARKEDPFFLYLAYNAPHWPLHALPEDIARYEGRYRSGWDATRTARHESLRGSGILDPRWEISPRDEKAPAWNDLDSKRREWEAMRMAVYAAQVDRMDQGIGKVLAKLDELGIADDTLVMFLSDNGGCAEFLSEDGFTLPCNSYTQDGQKVRLGNHQDIIPGDATTYMSYDLPWSNVSNSPFRLFKHWVHEGGISTPFVARWSKVIPAGELRHEPEHVVDIVPTCLEAAGVSHPSEIDGREVNPLNGESFMPALRGESWIRSEPIYFEHEGNRAVRDGQWKIVSRDGRPWELYDMENDRTELNDLAHGNASILNRYAQMYERWAPANDVIDWKVILPIGKRIEANR